MAGRAENIAAEFPPGVTMPEELRQLCDFLDSTGYPISGSMRLRPEGAGLRRGFGRGSEAWRQLAGFGSGPDGSVLALWLHAGPDATRAPVVHFGSEGDRLTVLADNVREFLALFAIGYDELGFDDLERPPKDPASAEKLRKWLFSTLGIVAPATGMAIVTRARARHPDFERWVKSVQR